jgi:CheY-like chemotaxis protein
MPSVLYAEDEAFIAETIADLLCEAGFAVHRAADGVEALQAAEKTGFDILLTDLHMPRMGGLDLIVGMRSLCPELPVVIITGNPPSQGLQALGDLGRGATLLLSKPVRMDQISSALMQALAA